MNAFEFAHITIYHFLCASCVPGNAAVTCFDYSRRNCVDFSGDRIPSPLMIGDDTHSSILRINLLRTSFANNLFLYLRQIDLQIPSLY